MTEATEWCRCPVCRCEACELAEELSRDPREHDVEEPRPIRVL